MTRKEMLKCLFESSSLREDLLLQMESVIYDLFDNIDLKDELVARVGKETYEFIKEYRNDKSKIR